MQSYHFLKRIFMLVNLLKIQFSLSSLKKQKYDFFSEWSFNIVN